MKQTKQGEIALAFAVVVTALSCGDSGTEPTLPTPVATTVTVTPASATLAALGGTVQLAAEVRDQNGWVMDGAPVTWSSSDAGVATVSSSGLATAVGSGSATITAASGTASGTVAVMVVLNLDWAALAALYNATDGPNWIDSENWLTDAPLGDWYGVTTEAFSGRVTRLDLPYAGLWGPIPPELGNLANLEGLYLFGNELSGPIPPELGNLANLEGLDLRLNKLSGPIPQTFLNLRLLSFSWSSAGVCAPGTSDFVEWKDGIETWHGGPFCNASDEAALTSLFDAWDGDQWTESAGWLGSPALEEWHGVRTDSLGRVTALRLSDNGLSGGLPAMVAELGQATGIWLDGNPLGGPLPLSLARLALQEFHYDDTELCEPADDGFQAWLDGIASRQGTGVECAPLTERDILEALYEATGGPKWRNGSNWLSDASLGRWHGVHVNDQGRVVGLSLNRNELSGLVPPELGNLDNLEWLYLGGNELSGPVPPELGNLANLEVLHLFHNELSGPVPPELGNLANLSSLYLYNNELSGPIPPELGGLANLEKLSLHSNDLSGPVPPEFGGLASARALYLAGNADLSGALPTSLTDLRLETLMAGNTDLCVPREPAFEAWLRTIRDRRIAFCDGALAAAYLTQAVQSRTHPVPLVAGENALLRAFVTAASPGDATMPPVVARFYLDGSEAYAAEIPATSRPIPREVDESHLNASANVEIPGRLVRPGLELVVEVDPEGTLDGSVGVVTRIPAEGRLAINVYRAPLFDLTVIPFLYAEDPDSSLIGTTRAMAAGPQDHELLRPTADLLPVGDMRVTAHAPVETSSNSGFVVLSETRAIRALEGGAGHWMGMLPSFSDGVGGIAHVGGRVSASVPGSGIIAHQLGHNFSLGHAPCGRPGGQDPHFPDLRGRIGAWGYAIRTVWRFSKGELVRPTTPDLMSSCGPSIWIGDYHFTKAFRFRLDDEGGEARRAGRSSGAALLLWGGVEPEGEPFLNPAFVADAPAALPDSVGDYTITGRSDGGGEVFSLSFAMSQLSEGGNASSFAFVLPVRPGWEAALASITLSGPDRSVTVDGSSDRPMAILLDPRTRQVRAILRDALAAPAAAAGGGPEVLFSRGIPDAAEWRR